MTKEKIIDRLSFPTEFNNIKELKVNIFILFLVCLTFFIISIIVINFKLILFTKALLIGTLAYNLILFYLTFDYIKHYIKKKLKKGKAKSAFNSLAYLVFGFLFLATALTLLSKMASVTQTTENKFISLLSALIIIVLPTIFWHEIIEFFNKKCVKYIKFLGILAFILLLNFNPVLAQNETTNATQPGWFDWLSGGLTIFSSASDMYNSFTSTISSTFNLDPWASQMVMIILILIIAFLLFKFLSFVIKWVVVGLVIWIITQLFLL